MKIHLPTVYGIYQRHELGLIRQVANPDTIIDGSVANYKAPGIRGKIILPTDSRTELLVVDKRPTGRGTHHHIIRASRAELTAHDDIIDLSSAEWLAHPEASVSNDPRPPSRTTVLARLRTVVATWSGSFQFVAEDIGRGIQGLRPPQIGAVHAIHAHWTVSEETATVVMPTGTGKTDTMIAILVSTPCPKVLVIVPTDALRAQLAGKFLTLGILRSLHGILAGSAQYPVVGTLLKRPTKRPELDEFFERCHVVVTTSHIVGQSESSLQQRMAHQCGFLFVDEAHHAEAPTWLTFKQHFQGRRIVQFTATPFREDGKALDGKIVYR